MEINPTLLFAVFVFLALLTYIFNSQFLRLTLVPLLFGMALYLESSQLVAISSLGFLFLLTKKVEHKEKWFMTSLFLFCLLGIVTMLFDQEKTVSFLLLSFLLFPVALVHHVKNKALILLVQGASLALAFWGNAKLMTLLDPSLMSLMMLTVLCSLLVDIYYRRRFPIFSMLQSALFLSYFCFIEISPRVGKSELLIVVALIVLTYLIKFFFKSLEKMELPIMTTVAFLPGWPGHEMLLYLIKHSLLNGRFLFVCVTIPVLVLGYFVLLKKMREELQTVKSKLIYAAVVALVAVCYQLYKQGYISQI